MAVQHSVTAPGHQTPAEIVTPAMLAGTATAGVTKRPPQYQGKVQSGKLLWLRPVECHCGQGVA